MLRTVKNLEDYVISATDGNIGHIKDVYFDDETWCVRFFVVETGTWLSRKQVLISPISIGHANWADKQLSVSITKYQVEHSPDIDTQKPVSRQQEIRLLEYYGYPYYWGGYGMWGDNVLPNMMLTGYVDLTSQHHDDHTKETKAAKAEQHKEDDIHLRSCEAVIDYRIQAIDGDIGHIEGLLIDEDTWVIRYIIVNTSNWWLGHQVLIPRHWIEDLSWSDASASVNLTQQEVKDAPSYNSNMQVDRKMEMHIYNHYGRLGYWMDKDKHATEKSQH
ncbi:PRC-barrel domain-containing protein [Shewanella sp. HL-SH2]|uniref:PRC-barrel domain-containing protein n=1 Tax=Shewanella sp. HL-SH2 TaxID=3436238 RepID=UPI003EBB0622